MKLIKKDAFLNEFGSSRGNGVGSQHHDFGIAAGLCDLRHVPVVREDDRLNPVANRSQCREAMSRSVFVERRKQVVANERRRLGAHRIVFEVGEPQRQIQLVAGTGAQTADRNPFAGWSAPNKPERIVIVKILADPVEAAAGQQFEQLTGPRHEWVLVGRAAAVDGGAEQQCPELEYGVVVRRLHQFGFGAER